MAHKIILSEKQFSEHFQQLAQMGLNVDGMVIVKHVVGSTKIYQIDGTSSPSDYWSTHYNEPIEPSDKICTSCMRKSERFVVGHVENKEQTKMWLYPVCNECNMRYKGKNAEHLFYARNEKLKELNIS